MVYDDIVLDSKVHGANIGSTWVLSAQDGSHVGPMDFAIWGIAHNSAMDKLEYGPHFVPLMSLIAHNSAMDKLEYGPHFVPLMFLLHKIVQWID